MNETPAFLAREFRLAAEYRRCAWYFVFGMGLVGAISSLLDHFGLVPGNGAAHPIFTAVVPIAPAIVLLAVALHWKVRVDENGLARRGLWKWDEWTWDDFAAGKIKRQDGAFVFGGRPWWCRKLTLGLLNEQDRAFVLGACNYFFAASEEEMIEQPRGEMVVRYLFWKTVTFRENGVKGRIRGRDFDLSWRDVQQVRLVYLDHATHELRGVELDVPGGTLRLQGVSKVTNPPCGLSYPVGSHSLPKELGDFLQAHVPAEKLVQYASHGPPETVPECDVRSKRLQKDLHSLAWYVRIVLPAMLVLLAVAFGPGVLALCQGPAQFPNVRWWVLAMVLLAVTILVQPLMLLAVVWYIRHRRLEELAMLNAWKAGHMPIDESGEGSFAT